MTKPDDSWSYYDTFTYEKHLYETIGLFYVGHDEIRIESSDTTLCTFIFSNFATEEQKNRIAAAMALGEWWERLANVSPTIFISDSTVAGIDSLIERGMPEDQASINSITFSFWSQHHLSFSLDINIDPFTVVDAYDWFQELTETVTFSQISELDTFFVYLHFCAINFRLTTDHIFTVYDGELERIMDMFEVVTMSGFNASMSEFMFRCTASALDELVHTKSSEHYSSVDSSEAIYKMFSEFPESKFVQIDSVFEKLTESNSKDSDLQEHFIDVAESYKNGSDDDADIRLLSALIVRDGVGAVRKADSMIRSDQNANAPKIETLITVSDYLANGGDDSCPVSWIIALNGVEWQAV